MSVESTIWYVTELLAISYYIEASARGPFFDSTILLPECERDIA